MMQVHSKIVKSSYLLCYRGPWSNPLWYRSRVREQLVLFGVRSNGSLAWIQRPRPCLLSRQILNLNLRSFRWDAKPDNIFHHSFPHGLNKRAHPIFVFLCALLLLLPLNWRNIVDKDGYVPKIIKHLLMVWNGSIHKTEATDNPPDLKSSLAANLYDKYGDAGIDALKEAWETVKGMEGSAEQKAVHAIMLAQAAARYKQEVLAEAKHLGLEDEVDDEGALKPSAAEPSTNPALGRFNLKAEEELVESSGDLDLEEFTKSGKVGFRDRKIIEYENRIRHFSTPDKVFRYFATFKLTDEKGNHEVMMTPEDFLRSLCPGEKQPDHLGLDQFIQIGMEEVGEIVQKLEKTSIFYQLGAGGLISFSDYIFLLTVLSTSRRHFQIAFKMFDLNGDGTVDAEEFEKVTTLLRSNSSTGARHRDHGTSFKGINSGLITFFFGENKKGTLTVDRFLEFQRQLQDEILTLEFKRKEGGEEGKISERDFADLLIAYAGFPAKKKSKMLRRVRKAYEEPSEGIHLKDYLHFYQVLYCINDIDTALTFHTIAGAPIERSTMKHVARTVAHVDLSDHLLDVVFTLFDDNGDGMLSNKEFVSVMKQRARRGLEKPKEIGISRIFSSVIRCAADCKPAVMGGVKKTE